jgi:GTP-binding protein YchF
MESLEKRIPAMEKKARSKDPQALRQLPLMKKVLDVLQEGRPARLVELEGEEADIINELQLITSKPILYACNVNEDEAVNGNEFSEKVKARAAEEGSLTVVISAEIEAQVASLDDPAEKLEYHETMGLKETGLVQVIREGYKLLDLITFFTIGPKEARAWTVHQDAKAPQASGEIHTDFERGFIKADTISYEDFIACGGETEAKNQGKMRQEGRDYLVHDGDVFHFKFNV